MLSNRFSLELFGRQHNLHAGWMTLGNQLAGVNIADPVMRENVNAHLNNKPRGGKAREPDVSKAETRWE